MQGQSTLQVVEVGAAFGLSAIIGLERELRHKSAGIRTYSIVGASAALFVLIFRYGFEDVLGAHVVRVPVREHVAQGRGHEHVAVDGEELGVADGLGAGEIDHASSAPEDLTRALYLLQ